MARAPAARAAPSIHCPRGQCAAGPTVPPIATLSSIYPHGGPTSGGTRLILRGHGFRDFRQALQCEFGALAEPATAWVEDADALTLNCTTPPRPIAERTRIRARLNSALRAEASLPFRYYDQPEVRGLIPSGGTARGGTRVTVLGAGFGPYPELSGLALCRFGSAQVAPDSVATAAAAAHTVAVAVGTDGQVASGSAAESLTGGGLGAANASAALRMHAPRFVTVAATIGSDAELRCVAPPSDTLGGLRVEVSLNGVDFSDSAPPALFEYYDNWLAARVSGVPPSPRRLHGAALVGSSWWVFGGQASQKPPSSLTRPSPGPRPLPRPCFAPSPSLGAPSVSRRASSAPAAATLRDARQPSTTRSPRERTSCSTTASSCSSGR